MIREHQAAVGAVVRTVAMSRYRSVLVNAFDLKLMESAGVSAAGL